MLPIIFPTLLRFFSFSVNFMHLHLLFRHDIYHSNWSLVAVKQKQISLMNIFSSCRRKSVIKNMFFCCIFTGKEPKWKYAINLRKGCISFWDFLKSNWDFNGLCLVFSVCKKMAAKAAQFFWFFSTLPSQLSSNKTHLIPFQRLHMYSLYLHV